MENISGNSEKENLLSIGELAEMYGITRRTLRHYQEKGLLLPCLVDETTGYRYYTRAQLPRLDLIMQMKNTGLSLAQIAAILDTRDLSRFEAILGEQIDRLNDQILQLRSYRNALERRLDSCRSLRNQPETHRVFLEYSPRRRAYIFPIKPYALKTDYHGHSPWTTALKQVKDTLNTHHIPLALFQQVGCIASRESLLQQEFYCTGAVIFLDEDAPARIPISEIPAGTYACMFNQYDSMDNLQEVEGIYRLLNYIDENGYTVNGPCYTQNIVDASVFDYDNTKVLVKQQIAIRPLSD